MRPNSGENIYWRYRYKQLKFLKIRPLGVVALLPTSFPHSECSLVALFQNVLKHRVEAALSFAMVPWRCPVRAVIIRGTGKILPHQIGTVGELRKRCDTVLGQVVVEYEAGVAWCTVMMQLSVAGSACPPRLIIFFKLFSSSMLEHLTVGLSETHHAHVSHCPRFSTWRGDLRTFVFHTLPTVFKALGPTRDSSFL